MKEGKNPNNSTNKKTAKKKPPTQDGCPYIIVMEDRWQKTVRSGNNKVHQTQQQPLSDEITWFCLNDDHNFAASAGTEGVFHFQACGIFMKPVTFTSKPVLS